MTRFSVCVIAIIANRNEIFIRFSSFILYANPQLFKMATGFERDERYWPRIWLQFTTELLESTHYLRRLTLLLAVRHDLPRENARSA